MLQVKDLSSSRTTRLKGGKNQLDEHRILSEVRSQNAVVVSSPSTSAPEHPAGDVTARCAGCWAGRGAGTWP